MSLSRNRSRINVKGGGNLQIRELYPTPSNTFLSVGWIEDYTFNVDSKMVESIDSGGRYVDNTSGGEVAKLSVKLMQSTKDEIDLVRTASGKYFEAYYVVPLNNGYVQEIVFPVCRITPGLDLSFAAATKRVIPVTVSALATGAALTRTPTNYNTVLFDAYVFAETAAAIGAPSDAATVPAAAI